MGWGEGIGAHSGTREWWISKINDGKKINGAGNVIRERKNGCLLHFNRMSITQNTPCQTAWVRAGGMRGNMQGDSAGMRAKRLKAFHLVQGLDFSFFKYET